MMKFVAIDCMLFLLSTWYGFLNSEICPGTIACTCNKETKEASCHRANLTYIPVLPKYIKNLNFAANFLKSINVSTFEPLEHLKLTSLFLVSCHINHLKPDSFSRLRYLLELDLSENLLSPRTVAEAVERIGSLHFQSIHLNYLFWRDEPTEVYLSLSRFKIKRFEMYVINFNNLNMTYLGEQFPFLEILFIGGGPISTIQKGFFPNLKRLNLNTNQISISRIFFGNETTCFFPNLS